MKLELVGELADQRHHPGVVRARAQFRKDRLLAADEEFDPENAVPAKRIDDLARLVAGRQQGAVGDCGGLPAFAIIAGFLAVADRRAEQYPVLGRHGQQGDLAVEIDKFLDDHPRPVAAHVGDRIIPRRAQFLGGLGGALALAARAHHRLDHARQADRRPPPRPLPRGFRRSRYLDVTSPSSRAAKSRMPSRFMVSCTALAEGATRQPSASSLASAAVSIASISGTMTSGLCALTAALQRLAVEHREHFERIGDLHRGRIGIAVAGDDAAAEALGGNGEFAAQLARAEQHHGCEIHARCLA